MSHRNNANSWRLLAAMVCLGGIVVSGCNKRTAAPVAQGADPAQGAVTAPSAADAGTTPATANPPAPANDRLHQTFAQATRQDEDPPAASERPVDQTMAGKSSGKLFTEVTRRWPEIRFTTAAGTRIEYVAKIETDQGEIEIEFLPDLAPNHVRNFIALAQAGYYDGLCFDRVRAEEGDEEPKTTLQQIEAGCPLGVGQPGFDHLGYWLNPEFDDLKSPKASHDAGTVGACRGDELDSAGTRFYITLNKAPFLDGNYTAFGKVVRGLDIARTIYEQPIVIDDKDVNGSRRPEKPVRIRKVTIQTRNGEGTR